MSISDTGRLADIALPAIAQPRVSAAASTAPRVAFLDNVRYLMVLLVVVYHAVAAYASIAPHWQVHDTVSMAADYTRELLDVFMMPVLFFVAGYFALPSLQKNGAREFLKDKVKRLLIPWALAVLIFLPIVTYDRPGHIRPFRAFWPWYLSSFQVRLRFSQAPQGLTTQAIYWFISLLFVFFVMFALAYSLARRWKGRAPKNTIRMAMGGSALVALMYFGLLTCAGYYGSLLLFPDSSWFTLHLFLEFQVTRLVLFAGYFAFGAYAQSRGLFAGGKAPGSLAAWAALSGILAIAYLLFGQPVFADTTGTAQLPAGYLLVFALVRSALLLSVLMLLVSAGISYWNRSRWLDRQLGATSYNIYLVHFWPLLALQAALLRWTGGPVPAKAGLVFLATLAVSYAISRWVLGRFPRALALGILLLFVVCMAVRP
jgi:peptidoglycan/LPS O-acetylase OafA/YrhL